MTMPNLVNEVLKHASGADGERRGYIRFGGLPACGRSTDHRDGHFEKGISAIEGRKDRDNSYVFLLPNHLVAIDLRDFVRFRPDKRVYFLKGRKVGADDWGAPLIADISHIEEIPHDATLRAEGVNATDLTEWCAARKARGPRPPVPYQILVDREMLPRGPRALLEAVRGRSTSATSRVHGEKHWRRVAYAGLTLCEQDITPDPLVVFLFALIHDSMRLTDGRDPDHGQRAADLARELQDGGYLCLDPERMKLLQYALIHHDRGMVSEDATIGVCWDADRLNLWRLLRRPDPALLSTALAKKPGIIPGSRTFQGVQFTWPYLFRFFGLVPDDEPLPAPLPPSANPVFGAFREQTDEYLRKWGLLEAYEEMQRKQAIRGYVEKAKRETAPWEQPLPSPTHGGSGEGVCSHAPLSSSHHLTSEGADYYKVGDSAET